MVLLFFEPVSKVKVLLQKKIAVIKNDFKKINKMRQIYFWSRAYIGLIGLICRAYMGNLK